MHESRAVGLLTSATTKIQGGASETQVEGEGLPSKCWNVRAIGRLEVEMKLGVLSVGRGGRECTDGGTRKVRWLVGSCM